MIYVEDLIERLSLIGNNIFLPMMRISSIDQKYVDSLIWQNSKNNGLTLKQRNLALSIASKYSSKLEKEFNIDIDAFLKNPQFKFPARTATASSLKEIKVLDNKQISVTFPYDQSLIDFIKQYKRSIIRSEGSQISWDYNSRSWTFPLTENSINFLTTFDGFDKDNEFLDLSSQVEKVKNNIENYIPMLSFENDRFIFKNTSEKIPNIDTKNVIEALIHARRYGVNIWDDAVNTQLDSGVYHETVLEFLRNFTRSPIVSNKNDNVSLIDLKELMTFSKDILFLIPAGAELFYLKQITELLISQNKKKSQVSVLFRLDNRDGKEFNEFVKTNHFNNMLSEETNYIFISSKIPKPLIEAKKYFDLVIGFNSSSAHYTLRDYLKNSHNIMFVDSIKGFECLAAQLLS